MAEPRAACLLLPMSERSRKRRISSALALAGAALLGLWLHFLFQNYGFFSDDFLNFIIARDMGLKWTYLARDVFGQFIPLYRLVIALYFDLAGLHFWLWFTMVYTATLGILGLLVWQARARGAHPLLLLPALAMAAFSPAFVNCYEWFSAGLEILPAALCGLAALFLAQDMASTWPQRRRAGCFALTAVGLLFYPKTLCLPILLLSVRLYERAQRPAPAAVSARFAAAARDLWPLLAGAALYVTIIALAHYGTGAPRPGGAALAEYVLVAWTHGFAAQTVGLDAWIGRFPWIANLIVIALLSASLACNRRGCVLWLGFLVYFAVCMTIIGLNRRVLFGLESALTRRYYCDILCYCIGLALIAHRGAKPTGRKRPALLVLGVIATLLLSLHLMRAETRVPSAWYAGVEPVRAFVRNVRQSLAQRQAGTRIADTKVPAYIMPDWMFPLNTTRYFLTLFPAGNDIAAVGHANAAFDDAGHLRNLAHTKS